MALHIKIMSWALVFICCQGLITTRVSSIQRLENFIVPQTIVSLNLVRIIYAGTGPSKEPIETPSVFVYILLLNKNAVLLEQS